MDTPAATNVNPMTVSGMPKVVPMIVIIHTFVTTHEWCTANDNIQNAMHIHDIRN